MVCPVASAWIHRQADRVTTVGTLSGFQDCFLQPIIKDRPNNVHKPCLSHAQIHCNCTDKQHACLQGQKRQVWNHEQIWTLVFANKMIFSWYIEWDSRWGSWSRWLQSICKCIYLYRYVNGDNHMSEWEIIEFWFQQCDAVRYTEMYTEMCSYEI